MFIKITSRSTSRKGGEVNHKDTIIMLNTNEIVSISPTGNWYAKMEKEGKKSLVTMTSREGEDNDCYYTTESVHQIRLQFPAVNMSTELIMAEVAK